MARIGINAQLLTFARTYRNAGSAAFIYHLLRTLPSLATSHQYTIFTNADCSRLPLHGDRRFRVVHSRLDTEKPAQRILWEQSALPVLLARHGIDVVHGTLNVLPLARRIPGVVTIHDVSFLRFPERFLPGRRRYLATFTRLSARGAHRVITSSLNTKRDVVRLLGVPEERVRVIYLGVEDRFREPIAPECVARFREEHRLPDNYFLFMGTLEPRKNLVRLLGAYQAARGSGVDWPLVLAGAKGWMYDEVFARVKALGLEEHVRFAGYVGDDEQPLWYRTAAAFVYPSLYEGFGLPVAEAMASGCPVLTARNSSLVEVAGDAAVLVDAEDEGSIAGGLRRIAGDHGLREELARRGRDQASRFDWRRTTEEVAQVYTEAAEGA